MASNTPRQRQYHAAVIAQLHNLSGDSLNLLLSPPAAPATPPDGKAWLEMPPRGRTLPRAVLTNPNDSAQQNTLLNIAANVPPQFLPVLEMPVRGIRRQQPPDPPNLLATTLLPLPDGRGHLAIPVPPVRRQQPPDPPNLLATTLLPLPDGRGHLAIPVPAKRRVYTDIPPAQAAIYDFLLAAPVGVQRMDLPPRGAARLSRAIELVRQGAVYGYGIINTVHFTPAPGAATAWRRDAGSAAVMAAAQANAGTAQRQQTPGSSSSGTARTIQPGTGTSDRRGNSP